jgi:hypothetical protein
VNCNRLQTVCEQSATLFTRHDGVQQFVNKVQQIVIVTTSDDGSQATKNPVVEHKGWDALLGFWGGLLLLRLRFWRDAFRWTCIPIGMRRRFYELFCPT